MKNILTLLLEAKNELTNNGWLSIPPLGDNSTLLIRVEWFHQGEKYGFEQKFTMLTLNSDRSEQMFQRFIRQANAKIKEYLAPPEQVHVWADGTWCHDGELEAYLASPCAMSGNYRSINMSSDEANRLMS